MSGRTGVSGTRDFRLKSEVLDEPSLWGEVRRITDVPGGILFANRNEGQRGQNSATILQDKAAAEH